MKQKQKQGDIQVHGDALRHDRCTRPVARIRRRVTLGGDGFDETRANSRAVYSKHPVVFLKVTAPLGKLT